MNNYLYHLYLYIFFSLDENEMKSQQDRLDEFSMHKYFHIFCMQFFPHILYTDEETNYYHITVIWSCNTTLWVEVGDISLLFDEDLFRSIRPKHPCPVLPAYPCTQTLSRHCYYLCWQIRGGPELSPNSALSLFHTDNKVEYQAQLTCTKTIMRSNCCCDSHSTARRVSCKKHEHKRQSAIVVVMRRRGVQRSKARGRGVGRWRHRFGKFEDLPYTGKWVTFSDFSTLRPSFKKGSIWTISQVPSCHFGCHQLTFDLM